MKEDTLTVVKMALLSGGGVTISLAEIESYLRIASILTTMTLFLKFLKKEV
jgi:hypothetical protein